jgi:hypothetical protein
VIFIKIGFSKEYSFTIFFDKTDWLIEARKYFILENLYNMVNMNKCFLWYIFIKYPLLNEKLELVKNDVSIFIRTRFN